MHSVRRNVKIEPDRDFYIECSGVVNVFFKKKPFSSYNINLFFGWNILYVIIYYYLSLRTVKDDEKTNQLSYEILRLCVL